MAVSDKRPKMRRTQISLMPDELETARKIAAERGVSLSQVFRDAIRRAAEEREEAERKRRELMWSIVGTVEGADPNASVDHDEILYGSKDVLSE